MSDSASSSDTSSSSQNLPRKRKRNYNKTKAFQESWLKKDDLKMWLLPVEGNIYKCRCKVCNVELVCGKSELDKHSQGKKHVQKMNSIKMTQDISKAFQQTDAELKHTNKVKEAEIKLSLFFAEHNVAFLTVDHLVPLLKDIFTDSKILSDVTLKRTKCTEIINNVLCQYEKNQLVSHLQKTHFGILVDESTDIGEKKSMCVLTRYIDNKKNRVSTQLLELIVLDGKDCSANKLYTAFKKCLDDNKIPVKNIVGVASDGANVMVGNYNSFYSHLREDVPQVLLMRCICHSSAIVASKAAEELPKSPEELLRLISTYISGSAKRCAILQELQEFFRVEQLKILKPSTTRWLSLHQCVDRIIINWNVLHNYFMLAVVEDKLKSSELILSYMQNIHVKGYLFFLKYALNFFNSFNALFQSRQILLHKLYSNSLLLLKQICQNYIKLEIVWEKDLGTINLAHPEYFVDLDHIHVGPECEEELKKLPKNDREVFLKKCLAFYTVAASEIQKRLPINNNLFKDLQFLDPFYAFYAQNRVGVVENLNNLSKHFKSSIDITKLDLEWQILPTTFTEQQKLSLEKLPIDTMWFKIVTTENYNNEKLFPNLGKLLNLVLVLPHSNAEAERIFSIVTDVKTKKRNRIGETSLNSVAMIRSSLQNNSETCVSYKVEDDHLALHNYHMYSFKN